MRGLLILALLFYRVVARIIHCLRWLSKKTTSRLSPSVRPSGGVKGLLNKDCYLEYNEVLERWEFFYESIQGFDFEPGYIYTLEVRLEDRGEIQDVGTVCLSSCEGY